MSDEIQVKDTSIDDDVRAAFESLKTPTAEVTASPSQPDLLTATPNEGETQEQADQRARDEQGRFAKAPKESNRVKAEGAPATPVVAAVDPSAPASQPVVSAVKAPDGWSGPMKAEFGKLPAPVQAEINRREQEMHRKFTSQDEDRTFGKKIKEIASPYQATIAAEGADVPAAFQAYLNTAYILRTGSPQAKAQALHQIAQQFSVDLGIPLQQGAVPHQQQGFDPSQVSRLVQAEVEKFSQKQEESKLTSEIEAFAADPAHIHFETVKPIMAALMQSGEAETLQDAYDQAIWAKPDIRSTLSAEAQARAEEQRKSTAAVVADKAKRAAGSVAGGPGGIIPNGAAIQDRSLDDEIRANFRAVVGGRI